MASEKLMIIDGNSIMNRAFYGLQGPQLLATSGGLYTNAIFGFLNILFRYLEEENPGYLCVAFDVKAPTFRHKEFEGYKANRKGMPPELAVQMPVIKEVLDAMGIKRLEYEGYEADDILGSVSLAAEQQGIRAVIVTGDRDSLQLISDTTTVKMPVTRGGRTETEDYDYNKVLEKYGVTPVQFIDVKGLMGDASDNIPGVPGIGEKTAVELIRKFGGMEAVYEKLDQVEKKGVREKLSANKELAFMSKRLATIERQVPGSWELEEIKRRDFDAQRLYEVFKRLEFKSLIEKLGLEVQKPMRAEVSREIECIREASALERVKSGIRTAGMFSFYYLIDRPDSFSSKLAGMGLSWGAENTAYFDFTKCIAEEVFCKEFKEIFQDPAIKKYGHDVKSLIVYLKHRDILFAGLAFDTMIAAYIINPSRDTYTLSELAEEHLQTEMEAIAALSGKGKHFVPYRDMPLEKLASLTGTYAELIFELKGIFDGILKENEQERLYYEIELPLVEVLADMEYWGFKVHVQDLVRFSGELDEKISVVAKDIYDLAGEDFNINSPKQLGVILFEKLGLPVLKKTKTGYSTDAEVLEQLAFRHQIVSRILEFRQLAKLKSTYAEGLQGVINPVTGKIHSNFNQTVTTTGRISSTEPNLQNIPIKLEMGRKIRKVFVPSSEEFLLLDADYSQIELRVLAHITGDSNMIGAFMNNEDIHTATASQVFGIPKEKVTSLMRSRAKAVNFGIVYGIGDFSLSKDLGVTRKEAKKYIDEYLNKYPNVRQYMHDIVEQGRETGFVTTLFHRRRYLPELTSSNFNIRSFGERIAMNTPIQGSAADIIKIAMVRVSSRLKERGLQSRLILQVHDELIVETRREEKEEVAQILKESMENAVCLRVPLSVDVKAGSNWYETK